jgi:sulfonate transport system permease protein
MASLDNLADDGGARSPAPPLGDTASTTPRGFRPPGWTIGLIVPLAALALWEGLARLGAIDARLFPPPSVLADTINGLILAGYFWSHVLATLGRVAAGFVLGAAVGTALGALTGYSPLARRLLDPTLQALRNIPSIAWVPLFILWFGIFETPKVMLIAVGVFFPVYLGLASAVAGTDRKLVEVGRLYGLSPWNMVRRIFVPAALPTYVMSLRSGLGLGWMFVVAAEFIGASEGLGYLLIDGQMTGRPNVVLAAILLFAVLGKASDLVLDRTGHRLLAWQDSYDKTRA